MSGLLSLYKLLKQRRITDSGCCAAWRVPAPRFNFQGVTSSASSVHRLAFFNMRCKTPISMLIVRPEIPLPALAC